MENEEAGSGFVAMGKEAAEAGSRLDANEEENDGKWMGKEDGGSRLDVKEKENARKWRSTVVRGGDREDGKTA